MHICFARVCRLVLLRRAGGCSRRPLDQAIISSLIERSVSGSRASMFSYRRSFVVHICLVVTGFNYDTLLGPSAIIDPLLLSRVLNGLGLGQVV